MPFPIMLIGFILYSTLIFSQDRKPAVEDFVGIEIEESKVTPYGDETLFNLEQDVGKIQSPNRRRAPFGHVSSPKKVIDPLTFLGISITLGLPFMVWFMVMSHLRKKAHQENASNIEILETYRKNREKKNEESLKKAS
jgi:hypothetical protein